MKYLALGDSYTIGEGLESKDSFPCQLTELLKKNGFPTFEDPTIIAQTGWTSQELWETVSANKELKHDFDLVTLLIGVNDQYRGLSIEDYKKYFLKLLTKAILLAKGQSRHVYVVSIPDWGATPFAKKEGKDPAIIAKEIKAFNQQNNIFSMAYRCHYINVTPLSIEQAKDPANLTDDQLHYAAQAYKEWAIKAMHLIRDKAIGA